MIELQGKVKKIVKLNGSINVIPNAPDGYIRPSGTKAITENGTHDVTEYAAVSVDVAAEQGADSPDATAVSFVKDGDVVTETSTLEGGTLATSTINLDDAGNPVSVVAGDNSVSIAISYDENGNATTITVDGESIPVSWEGF